VKPVLLLITGMLNDESVWRDVLPLLDAGTDVRIALPVQDSISAMATAAWAQVADVPTTTPVVLAGFSLGGYVAQEMLARPQMARQLKAAALLSTSPRPETAEGAAVRERTMAAMQKNFEKVVEGIATFGTCSADAALAERLRSMMLGVGLDTAIRQNRAIMARSDHRAALSTLKLPVAVLCGAQDRITPPELSKETAALVPGARLEIVEGAGHMLPCERPEAVARVLRGLLA
jgi:pimeloyl-ACP methyl ester carboxylesterase